MPSWRKVITSGSDASLSSLIVTDGGITGSLLGTASYAVTASYIDPTLIFPYTGSAIITGSLQVIGTLTNGDGTPVASGDYSHAEGLQTISSGSYSHAEGISTVAFGSNSHAEGQNSISSGSYSHAEGSGTLTIGNSAHSEGDGTQAIGDYAHSEGDHTNASGNTSHAEGYYTQAGWRGFTITSVVAGLITISDNVDYSSEFTTGQVILDNRLYTYNSPSFNSPYFTIQLDDININAGAYVADTGNLNSHAVAAIPQGNYTHAEGENTLASGLGAHSEGKASRAYGEYSHAEGTGTTIGDYSHAEGGTTLTIGEGSHAEGKSSIAIGNYSHAEGDNTRAGWRAFTVSSVVAGLITIADNIDYSAEFPGNSVILDNIQYYYNAIAFSAPNFTIQLDDITVNGGSYVADSSNLNSSAAVNLLGAYSHTEGGSTQTFGNYSHAEGYKTEARGVTSHAEGDSTIASGNTSHAEGINTIASGYYSHAEGQDTAASGQSAHAEGVDTRAIGYWSHAEGGSTRAGWRAFTVSSVVAGLISIDDNIDYSAEFFSGTVILDNQLYTYNSTSFSSPSFTIQLDNVTINSGNYIADLSNLNSVAASNVLGSYSHAEGNNTNAIGDNSHAEGVGTTATNGNSHAEGNYTIASGGSSHAEGASTIASGDTSHAEGDTTIAIGTGAHSEGSETISGWRAFTVSSVVAGLITISDNIDYTSEFTGYSGNVLLDYKVYSFNTLAFNSPDFTIQLDDITVNGGSNVAELGNLNSPLASISARDYGHAEGRENKALGNYSHAEGRETVATNDGAHSEGTNTRAEGSFSHAEGASTIASGNYSHAEGYGTTAIGGASHAEGRETVALGNYSHAEGYHTTASGLTSHAEGYISVAIGQIAHAEGYDTNAGWKGIYISSVVAGLITISNNIDYSSEFTSGRVILDIDSNIYTYNSINYISPDFTIQLDDISVNTAAVVADLAVLNSTYANSSTYGEGSHAEGNSTQAIGDYSHAEGRDTIATGQYSHAEGNSTQALGDNSHAEGYGTIAASADSHVSGLYNITSSVVGAFIVGNGVDDATRSNLLFAGDSTVQITGSLQVTGGITGSVYGMPFLRNKTNPSATDTITINQSIFNPANLTVLSTSIFIIEADADYYVLGDLINSGSIVVDGTLKVGGVLYNAGTITGTGIIE